MKQHDVITLELSTAAPTADWIMVNGWPRHNCGVFAQVASGAVIPMFICTVCGVTVLNADLPSASDDYAAQ